MSTISRFPTAMGDAQDPSGLPDLFLNTLVPGLNLDSPAAETFIPHSLSTDSPPYMYTSMPLTPGDTTIFNSTFTLGSGSVWIPASQFTATAPASTYIGLKIDSGRLVMSNPTVSDTATLSLAISSTSSTSTGTLLDASVTIPAQVEFVFNEANANLTQALDGHLVVFGVTTTLGYIQAQATYEDTIKRLQFPFHSDVSSLLINQSNSTLAKFSGTAPIQSGAWSLPLKVFDDTGSFTDVTDNGGMSLTLGIGIAVLPPDRNLIVNCGPFVMIVTPGLLTMRGAAATSKNSSWVVSLGLNGEPDPTLPPAKSILSLRNPDPFNFLYVNRIDGLERWERSCSLSASLDKPRTINGARVAMDGEGSIQVSRRVPTQPLRISVSGIFQPSERSNMITFALKNLLLQTKAPTHLEVTGTFANGTISPGAISVNADFISVLPFLPDPYATNISSKFQSNSAFIGSVTIGVNWDDDPTQTPVVDLFIPPLPLELVHLWDDNSVSTNATETSDGPSISLAPTLLDLSTNCSQFGVSFSSSTQFNSVSDLYMQAELSSTRVFALPAVQWEPVVALENPNDLTTSNITDIYSFTEAGPPTVIESNSVVLVPIAPIQILEAIVDSYSTDQSVGVTASFALPFGTTATIDTQQSQTNVSSPPTLQTVSPSFDNPSLTGCDQISFLATAAPGPGGVSPDTTTLTLPGHSEEPANAQDGEFRTVSIIDIPPSAANNNTLSTVTSDSYNGTFRDEIPINRIDISGFGESLFSDWRTGDADTIGVTKVAFDVVVGRASREVVQVRSVVAPYAIRVVRTMTIERSNSGVVTRSDSGWQAVSDGNYEFPTNSANPIITHPGIVEKATNVKNIRDLADNLVNFDCTLVLENSIGAVETPALNQLGYVYFADDGGKLVPPSPQDYAVVLENNTLGGPVDCTINIGGSNMLMRITRVGIASTTATNNNNNPEFTVAVYGSPVLPKGGQWSFARFDLDAGKSLAVDKDNGVPLIRQGPSGGPAAPQNPYRFADPADLLSADNPILDYGIIHGTDSHRTLFPRPFIDPTAAIDAATGALIGGLTSKLAPYIADSFALGTSSGIFPDLKNCIQLLSSVSDPTNPDPTNQIPYIFNIHPENNLVLQDITKFPLDPITRVLQGDGNFKSAVRTAGKILQSGEEEAAAAYLMLNTIDQTWQMDITKLSMVNYGQDVKEEVSRVAGYITSASSEVMAYGSALASSVASGIIQKADQLPALVFGAALQKVQAALGFLSALGVVPPLRVAMTNAWSITLGTSMGRQEFLDKIPPGPARDEIADIITELDLALKALLTLSSADFTFSLQLGVKVPTQFGPTAIGTAGFALNVGSSNGVAVRLNLGAGIGVNFDVGPFHALAYFGVTQGLTKADTNWAVSTTAVVKAHVDIVVASADLLIEAGMTIATGTCPDDWPANTPAADMKGHTTSIAAYAQVEIAIDVSIFWVVNVHVHEQAEWDNNFKGNCTVAELTAGLAGSGS